MATALLLWSSSKEEKQENSENTPPSAQDLKPESSKPRSRRSSKPSASSGAQKRPPQRGLGVAQLERLRLQERWRKFIESDPSQAHSLHFQFPFPASDPQASLSMGPFPPPNYGAVAADSQMRGQFGNGGFPVVGREFTASRGAFPGQPAADRLRTAAAAAHEARLQMARELSSSQMPQCLSDQCEVCAKKKRIQGENPFNGWNGSSSSRFPDADMDGCNFLGLNLGGGRAVDRGSKDFGGRGERCGGSSGMHVLEGVDVTALAQRKGKSVGESILKEYEFFPGKGTYSSNSSSSSSRGGVSAAVSAAGAVAGEACSPSPSSSSVLDLSLKLSL